MSTDRRTKRRYAHELYPHPEEAEARPLTVEVPYLYARALGLDMSGTSWFDHSTPEDIRRDTDRTMHYIQAGRIALAADAMLQGLTGDAAWKWVDLRCTGDSLGEFLWERATHYGVPVDAIKPYPCGPEPDHHDHLGEETPQGWRTITRIEGRESECDACTEPVPAESEVE